MARILVLVLISSFVSACAIGPLVSHETARTIGESNNELIGGYGQAGYAFKWNYGLTENLDLGVQYETLSLGLRVKYAFLNNEQGWSLAAAGGLGESLGGSHMYADFITSYAVGSWEPYFTGRFVRGDIDPIEFRNKDTGDVNYSISGGTYTYMQVIFGTRYWIDENWLFSVEASGFGPINHNLLISGLIFGAGLGYRF